MPTRPRPPARYAVGVVHYRTYRDLDRCLERVQAQSLPPDALLVVDADPIDRELEALRVRHPGVVFAPGANRGFAAGANAAVAKLREVAPQSAFVLILNPDVELEPTYAEALLAEMEDRPQAAIGTGKLLRREGRILDSAGIELPLHRRPRDRGSEAPDRGQYDATEYVFGASGAAMMLRTSAIEDLALEGELFDEDFFMYHEDTDLSWRANTLGWRVLYAPAAEALHGRNWQRRRRFSIAPEVRRHSFKNHYLQLIKNERARDFARNAPILAGWEIARLVHALLRDRAVLAGYRDAARLAGNAWRKRRILQARIADRRRPPDPDRRDPDPEGRPA